MMACRYSEWQWSIQYRRYFMYLYDGDGNIADTIWQGPQEQSVLNANQLLQAPLSAQPNADPRNPRTSPSYTQYPAQGTGAASSTSHTGQNATANASSPASQTSQTSQSPSYTYATTATYPNVYPAAGNQPSYFATASNFASGHSTTISPGLQSAAYASYPLMSATNAQPIRRSITSLPNDVQQSLRNRTQRFIRTGTDSNTAELLDPRYRRVAVASHDQFFVLGRVFKMLWIEPAGQENPGQTRGSTHFSTVSYGERAFSEIRRFVVVRNRGTFSQCIPVQTYRGRGATKPGLIMQDHGVIHTSETAPPLLEGEHLTKYSIRVIPTADEVLEPASRVNYGKPYAVEHNVKVLDVGMVFEDHRYLIPAYFKKAMEG